MVLQVNRDGSLRTFQQQFNAYYPFLKIEFFKKISEDKSRDKMEIFFNREIKEKLNGSIDGLVNIDVNGKRTIAQLENDFEKSLGLSAHVFRKSGNVWVETTLTNDWSLEDQNEEGKQISSHFTDNDRRINF